MSIPWVEKYRPKDFSEIVLDSLNKKIFMNIIEKRSFPNLLLYGPPGTGKTTTIINLINGYQERYFEKNKDLIIHLNASDERGIDIIRNQIHTFVNSKSMFNKGMKFIILDEIDYMTKNAQQALRYLMNINTKKIRFCLICNYISKIDQCLQDEFIKIRFNNLPTADINIFLKNIVINEKLNISDTTIEMIQKNYKSDLRSMINYLQLNQGNLKESKIINNLIWKNLLDNIKNQDVNTVISEIFEISKKYNMEKKNIIKDFINYIIRNNKELVNSIFLDMTEFMYHDYECCSEHFLKYFIFKMKDLNNFNI